jgi:uncharacterized protein YqgC (DUF456 family)
MYEFLKFLNPGWVEQRSFLHNMTSQIRSHKTFTTITFLAVSLSACDSLQEKAGFWIDRISFNLIPALQVVIAVVMLMGVASLFLVIIPGLTVIWLAALIYGILTGFTISSGIIFAVMTALMLFGNVTDQLMMGARAKKSGASWTGVVLSTISALVFSILLPPFGGLIAALVVLFAFEAIRLKDLRQAGGTTSQMAVGCAGAILVRVIIGLVMIGLWVLWVWLSPQWPF